MKKKIVLWMTLMIAVAVTGCTQDTTTVAVPETPVQAEQETPAEEQNTEPVSVVIYYGNMQADGFDQKEVEIDSLTAENILEQLAKVNVVSIDTEVNSFEQDGKSLKLDLSKGFSQYINMMGTSGEYIVIGGMVNTFLSAYEAEDILITVNGEVLETGHAVYENPLTFFENNDTDDGTEKEEAKSPMSYRLKDETYKQAGAEIYYPQFTDMSDGAVQDQWNAAIREITVGAAEKMNSDYESYKVDYTIKSCDTEFVSFVFTQEINVYGHIAKDIYAISFDMVEGKNVRLSDWGEAVDTAAYNLANHGYYKILSDDVDRETYDEYMKTSELSADEFKKEFLQYDYELEDLDKVPAGTSYVKDGELIIIMDVPEALGGALEIATGIEVR